MVIIPTPIVLTIENKKKRLFLFSVCILEMVQNWFLTVLVVLWPNVDLLVKIWLIYADVAQSSIVRHVFFACFGWVCLVLAVGRAARPHPGGITPNQ